MPSATFVLFNSFLEAEAESVHNLGADQLVVALTNVAPDQANDTVLTDITEVAYTYLSTRNITTTSSSQAAGTYKLILADLALTSTGGNTGPFRYVVIYNDDAATDELIGYADYGSSISILDTQSLTLDFNQTAGVISKAVA